MRARLQVFQVGLVSLGSGYVFNLKNRLWFSIMSLDVLTKSNLFFPKVT